MPELQFPALGKFASDLFYEIDFNRLHDAEELSEYGAEKLIAEGWKLHLRDDLAKILSDLTPWLFPNVHEYLDSEVKRYDCPHNKEHVTSTYYTSTVTLFELNVTQVC